MPLRDGSCYVIAEFGSNHYGAIKQCELAVQTAADSGADAVKFQLFRLEDILIDPSKGDRHTELPVEFVPKIADYCREYRIDFLCTPFAPWAVAVLDEYVGMWKIGSFEHHREDIWNACIATKKPIIASCGRMKLAKIGDKSISPAQHLLYCVSKYPTYQEDIYIQARENGGYAGFSDHTTSTVIPALAVARGARIIEKHFRLDSTPTDSPDYAHSLTPSQLAEMVSNIRLAELTCWRQPPADVKLEVFSNRRE